jgi:hypothetical protein
VFAIFVAKAPGLVWQAKTNREGKVIVRRPKSWPLVYHYHFHIVDLEWGHVTIRMSGHPPFGLQISLNGHEWVERQARKQAISWVKEGNCFVGVSDLAGINGWPNSWTEPGAWRYWGKWWIAGCIRPACVLDSTASSSNVRAFATRIPATKQRPSKTKAREGRLEKIIERLAYDLTAFKVHFGKLTLKMYDKGDRVLRMEIIVNNIEELRCGKRLEKLPEMLERLETMVVAFLEVVQAAHLSFVDGQQLDALAVPIVRGARRRAGWTCKRRGCGRWPKR